MQGHQQHRCNNLLPVRIQKSTALALIQGHKHHRCGNLLPIQHTVSKTAMSMDRRAWMQKL